MNNGWIKLHRQLLENPVIMKDADYIALWAYILLNAMHSKKDINFSGKRHTLLPGEFTTGRKIISSELKISESKVQRILKCFESEQQIEQRTDRQCRLIKVLKWDEYQCSEQRNEQRANNDRTTSEQRVNTKEECKKEKNKIKESDIELLDDFLERYPKKLSPSKLKFIEKEIQKLSENEKGELQDFLLEDDIDFGKVDEVGFIKSPQNWIVDKGWKNKPRYKVEWNDKFLYGTKEELKNKIGEKWFVRLKPTQFIPL